MDIEIKKVLVKHEFEKSRKALKQSDNIFKSNDCDLQLVVNRLYYAMFYAVNGLFITKDFMTSKHASARSIFISEFAKKGLIGNDSGKFYSDMFNKRQEGDYTDIKKYQNVDIKNFKFTPIEFDKTDVQEWLKKGHSFVDSVEQLSHKLLQDIGTGEEDNYNKKIDKRGPKNK
ncbi:MAG: HEPN domain-containing protein [bacterium]